MKFLKNIYENILIKRTLKAFRTDLYNVLEKTNKYLNKNENYFQIEEIKNCGNDHSYKFGISFNCFKNFFSVYMWKGRGTNLFRFFVPITGYTEIEIYDNDFRRGLILTAAEIKKIKEKELMEINL